MLEMPELLLSVPQLKQLIDSGRCVLVDCRFDLSQPQQSRQDYLDGHIPGAFYAHLDSHLASEITPHSGRHPLPEADVFSAFLASINWQQDKLLVAYDAGSGAFAARLWWLMRYFGLQASLLDGGLAAWKEAGLPLQQGVVETTAGIPPKLREHQQIAVTANDILEQGDRLTLLDARAAERFSGAIEPLDSKAGHIPGALNRPFAQNLDASGRFKNPGQLLAEFSDKLADRKINDVVHYCGSGVTACHNAFAMELAGLKGSRIYPGSWSEWIRDPGRPVETAV
jgi:thiosulfate/3-mercaptopyruvate sulfurtransferase